MGKIATKTATKQLQKLFNLLGEFGGSIETDDPRTWWKLDLEVEDTTETEKIVLVGVFSVFNGDVMYDPQFRLSLKMENGKIAESEILSYYSQTFLGTLEIDEDDIAYGYGFQEKDEYGLKKRFSSFMENMTKVGPYLTNPKKVSKYTRTLVDG